MAAAGVAEIDVVVAEIGVDAGAAAEVVMVGPSTGAGAGDLHHTLCFEVKKWWKGIERA